MLIIQRPTVEVLDQEQDNRQRFAVGPLDPGFGTTLGNSLRRTLLSSIPGGAVTQLREKQKARRIYGILETQFRNMYEEANRQPGITGENLLRNLELRLDNVVFRAGWGASRRQARQFVRHGHIHVNGKRVTIPSYRVRKGDKVTLREATRGNFLVRRNMDTLERQTPAWLETGDAGFSVAVLNPPLREHIDEPVQEQLIVELYSK